MHLLRARNGSDYWERSINFSLGMIYQKILGFLLPEIKSAGSNFKDEIVTEYYIDYSILKKAKN